MAMKSTILMLLVGCPIVGGVFICNDGLPIADILKCNGIRDCLDNSDERDCCRFSGYHQCRSQGICISPSQVCNGFNNCADWSDETNCTETPAFPINPGDICPAPNQLRCPSGRRNCISKSFICDNYTDCDSGIDEINFKFYQLPTTPLPTCKAWFLCDRGKWICNNQVCDGYYDCSRGDYSDERNCRSTTTTPYIQRQTSLPPTAPPPPRQLPPRPPPPTAAPPPMRNEDFTCGKEGLQSMIFHGDDGFHGQYPWMVYLYIRFRNFNKMMAKSCGGSLISDRWVLTAANCLVSDDESYQFYDVKLTLGQFDLSKSAQQFENGLRMNSTEIFIHPCFIEGGREKQNEMDAALIKLPRRIQFKWNIRPICLPSKCDSGFSYFSKLRDSCFSARIAGWGKTENGVILPKMQVGNVKILSHLTCEKYYNGLSEHHICANGSSSHVCLGDFGSPIMCRNYTDSSLFQLGIASFGSYQCQKSATVFSRFVVLLFHFVSFSCSGFVR